MLKKCTNCKEFKDLSLFHHNKSTKDGISLWCKMCKKMSDARYQKNNPEKVNANANKWQKANPNKRKETLAQWQLNNLDKHSAKEAKRRAIKIHATPNWLTENHLRQMGELYKNAAELTASTGIRHEVDHVIPLRGEHVNGLHVPWNLQILTKSENCKKSNKIIEL